MWKFHSHWGKTKWPLCLQAQESATLSEEVRVQLEQVQQRLSLVREEVVENSISREKESFNARRAQVSTRKHDRQYLTTFKRQGVKHHACGLKLNIFVKRLEYCAITFILQTAQMSRKTKITFASVSLKIWSRFTKIIITYNKGNIHCARRCREHWHTFTSWTKLREKTKKLAFADYKI